MNPFEHPGWFALSALVGLVIVTGLIGLILWAIDLWQGRRP